MAQAVAAEATTESTSIDDATLGDISGLVTPDPEHPTGEGDADTKPTDGQTDDAGSTDSPDGDETPGSEQDADDGPQIEIDGKSYAVKQVNEALEALGNKSEWSKSMTQRDQELAAKRKSLHPVENLITTLQKHPDLIPDVRDAIVDEAGEEAGEALDKALEFKPDEYPNPHAEELEKSQSETMELRFEIEKRDLAKEHKLSDKKVQEVVDFAVKEWEENKVSLTLKDAFIKMDYPNQVEKAKKTTRIAPVPGKSTAAVATKKTEPEGAVDIMDLEYDGPSFYE